MSRASVRKTRSVENMKTIACWLALVMFTSSGADQCSQKLHNIGLFLKCVVPSMKELINIHSYVTHLEDHRPVDCRTSYVKTSKCIESSGGFCKNQDEIPELMLEYLERICEATNKYSILDILRIMHELINRSRMFDTYDLARSCIHEAGHAESIILKCIVDPLMCKERLIEDLYVCMVSSWHGKSWAEEFKADLDFFLRNVYIQISEDPFCTSRLTLPKVMCKVTNTKAMKRKGLDL